MTEHNELAGIIDDRWHGYGYNPQGAADAILAAGYRKSEVALAEAWDEGRKHGATYPYGERGLATDDNPYRSQP